MGDGGVLLGLSQFARVIPSSHHVGTARSFTDVLRNQPFQDVSAPRGHPCAPYTLYSSKAAAASSAGESAQGCLTVPSRQPWRVTGKRKGVWAEETTQQVKL